MSRNYPPLPDDIYLSLDTNPPTHLYLMSEKDLRAYVDADRAQMERDSGLLVVTDKGGRFVNLNLFSDAVVVVDSLAKAAFIDSTDDTADDIAELEAKGYAVHRVVLRPVYSSPAPAPAPAERAHVIGADKP